MTPADAKILAEELIALNALTNSSYVSNNGVLQQAKLAGIILDLVAQLEVGAIVVKHEYATPQAGLAYEPDPIEIADVIPITMDQPVVKRRGRPRKVKDE